MISGQGVAVDYAKVKSVVEWPVPHNVKGVRGFLGPSTIESSSKAIGKLLNHYKT